MSRQYRSDDVACWLLLTQETPSIADLEVFGVLQAIRGMDTFVELQAHSGELAAWYARMAGHCTPSRITADGAPFVDPRGI